MTVIDLRPHRPSLGQKLAFHVDTLRQARRRNAAYRSVRRELEALSPRELADMGIHPAQIDDIAREAAAGA